MICNFCFHEHDDAIHVEFVDDDDLSLFFIKFLMAWMHIVGWSAMPLIVGWFKWGRPIHRNLHVFCVFVLPKNKVCDVHD